MLVPGLVTVRVGRQSGGPFLVCTEEEIVLLGKEWTTSFLGWDGSTPGVRSVFWYSVLGPQPVDSSSHRLEGVPPLLCGLRRTDYSETDREPINHIGVRETVVFDTLPSSVDCVSVTGRCLSEVGRTEPEVRGVSLYDGTGRE